MEEKELWMNKLKEKLGDYSEPLPASGWEQLEKELMPPVERKIYPYRKWTVAAAAVILLALGSSVSLYFLGTPAADEIRHAKTPALASVPDVLPDAQQPDMTGTTIEPVVRPEPHRESGTEHSPTNGKYRRTGEERRATFGAERSDRRPERKRRSGTGGRNESHPA